MLKKSITYTDYNGEKQTDECYFNLSKAELLEMEMSEKGGFENYIKKLMEEKDNKKIYALFKDLILMSYGQKSADGRTFIKKKMVDGQMIYLKDEFEQTEAFTELMMELISGGDEAMAKFINALIPKEIAEQAAKQLATQSAE